MVGRLAKSADGGQIRRLFQNATAFAGIEDSGSPRPAGEWGYGIIVPR
jgi:hypothetical protein